MNANLFSTGNYEEILNILKSSLDDTASQEDSFAKENNIAVCQNLNDLYLGDKVELYHQSVETFLRLYDNCRVFKLHSHSNSCLPLQLTVLFNCHMCVLNTHFVYNYQDYVWDELIDRISETCADISGLLFSSKNDSMESLFSMILSTKETIEKSHTRLLGIFLELISTSIIILLLRTNLRDTLTTISSSISKILDTLPETIALNKIEFELASEIETKEIFKYGLSGGPQLFKDVNCEQALGTIALLGSLTSFLQGDSQSKRIHLPGKESLPAIWFFIEALRKFESDDFVGCLGMLMHGKKHTLSKEMGAQYHCLLGQTYSAMRERQKALDNYKKAIVAVKNFTLAHYCMGIECGKMGLHDSMLKSYQNLVMSTKKEKLKVGVGLPIEACVISLLREMRSVSRVEAMYLIAVSYGLNDMFQESSEVFEKLLSPKNLNTLAGASLNSSQQLIKLPHLITILHEASSVNLLVGNLERSEDLCRQAMTFYPNRPENPEPTDTHGTKDKQWIQDLINEDLHMDIEIPEPCLIYEDYLSFFDEDIIGLLLLADLQKLSDPEAARLTLNQSLLLLSKHIARLQKAGESPESQGQTLLVKSLTAKTCLHIARNQTESRPFADVDKMFKRALSCNNGDRDVLYHYASFLADSCKLGEAHKLWATFFEKSSPVNPDEIQSLSLRYLLRTQISQRQIVNLGLKVGGKT